MKVTVTNTNPIGKVNFSKVAKVSQIKLSDLSDVVVPITMQNGAVLTYNYANNVYVMENTIDGGEF